MHSFMKQSSRHLFLRLDPIGTQFKSLFVILYNIFVACLVSRSYDLYILPNPTATKFVSHHHYPYDYYDELWHLC